MSSSSSPALSWMLEMLAASGEPVDVHIRPRGDRRRENKVHLSTVDVELLGRLLDVLRDLAGPVSVEGNPRAAGSAGTAPAGVGEADDEDELTPLDLDILRVLREAGGPLLGKVVASRLGRKPGCTWARERLARLVKLGHVDHGRRGYRIAADTTHTTADKPRCTEDG